MRLTGKDVFYLALTGVGLFVVYRVVVAGDTVANAFSKFWTGLTFDTTSLGPAIALPPGAAAAQADYIAKGFMTPDGKLTAAGEAYIKRMQEKVVTGEVINNAP
jgi:hypothetical protein